MQKHGLKSASKREKARAAAEEEAEELMELKVGPARAAVLRQRCTRELRKEENDANHS